MSNIRSLTNKDVELFSLKDKIVYSKIVYVYDGDTCNIIFNMEGLGVCKFNCRLEGVDTPEMKPSKSNANRDEEIRCAKKIRNILISHVVNSKSFDVTNDAYTKKEIQEILDENTMLIKTSLGDFDKYGRLLIKLYNNDDKCINDLLIETGLAYEYDGGTKQKFKDYSKE